MYSRRYSYSRPRRARRSSQPAMVALISGTPGVRKYGYSHRKQLKNGKVSDAFKTKYLHSILIDNITGHGGPRGWLP